MEQNVRIKDFGENDELISIVVPVYNAERFISETIHNVQEQSYTNWELLLVDDCSTDSSYQICTEISVLDKRVRPVRLEHNQGAACARNRGIEEANGRYLCFLDADDIWEQDKLERELSFCRKKDAAFVFTGYEVADEKGQGLGKIVHVPESITYRKALGNTTIFTSTVMIDRAKIEDEYIFMPPVPSEDTATWWKILKKYGIGYGLDENLVRYRRSEGTLSSNKAVAIKRIWNLYRRQEKMSVVVSSFYMCLWAIRAVLRRI